MSVELLGKSLSDLSIVTMIFRIILSMACGGVIGLERGKANQPAGMRTYMLVSLGSCVVMITGEFLFYKYGAGDPARLGAQVVSGIGFLGAGSIVISGLWASACIGLVIGIGFFECGIVATLAVYVIIRNFKKLEDRITFNDGWFSVYVRLEDVSNLSDFYTGIKDMGMKVGEVQVYDKKHEFKGAIVSIQNCAHRDREDVLSLLNSLRGVIDVKYIS